MNNSATKK